MWPDTMQRSTFHYAGHYRGEVRSSNRKEDRGRGRRRQRIAGAARHPRPPVRRGRGDVRDQRSPVEAASNSNAAPSTSSAGDDCDHRSVVVAVVARKKIGAAEGAVEMPGQRRTVPGAGEGAGDYEVGGPVDPHRRRPGRDRQMQRLGVVGDDDGAPTQQPREPAQGETPAEVEGSVRHAFCYRGGQSAVLLDPDGDPCSGARQGVSHDRELLRWPPAPPQR